ncbi:MAG TPA: hypothetical protein VMF06_20650 [Candidatus Limnocylindria bacterium]|jgi:hypothetical protein|nr:hypothetical protein [Candidatus Limnocylindria bacterium]
MKANASFPNDLPGLPFRWAVPGLIAGFLALCASALAGTIADVTAANVTPSGFSVVWRSVDADPGIRVYTDAAGTHEITGQLGVEDFPVRTGNSGAATPYERRASKASLKGKSRSLGLMQVQVTGCAPATTYYYKVTSTPSGQPVEVFPASGPLPSVTTPKENSFVISSQALLLDVPGVDTDGQIMFLRHPSGGYPIAAVVGDGAGTNQVFLSISDLFAASGAGNLQLQGSQTFTADLFGGGGSDTATDFTLVFGTALSATVPNHRTFNVEYLAIDLGSTILETGTQSSIPITFQSDAEVSDLSVVVGIPAGYLGNFTLQVLAGEVDPAASSFTSQSGTNYLLHLKTKAGQVLTGSKLPAILGFAALGNAPSGFVPLNVITVTGKKADNTQVEHPEGQDGQAIVIGATPLLVDTVQPNGSHVLTLYAKPWSGYQIESTDETGPGATWRNLLRVPATNLVTTLNKLPRDPGVMGFRASKFVADPPLLDAYINPDESRRLVIYSQPSRQFTVEYRTNLDVNLAWRALVTPPPLTNSFQFVTLGSTNDAVLYRLKGN